MSSASGRFSRETGHKYTNETDYLSALKVINRLWRQRQAQGIVCLDGIGRQSSLRRSKAYQLEEAHCSQTEQLPRGLRGRKA